MIYVLMITIIDSVKFKDIIYHRKAQTFHEFTIKDSTILSESVTKSPNITDDFLRILDR